MELVFKTRQTHYNILTNTHQKSAKDLIMTSQDKMFKSKIKEI